MKKVYLILIAAIFMLSSNFTMAEEAEFLSITKVTDNVYNLHLNVGVVVGEEYVVLIESGYGEYKDSNKKILAAVKSITDKPIKYVINMHSHGDHSGGNNFFAERGATIITQKNAIYSGEFESKYPKNNLISFEKNFALNLGNEVIEIEHMISHTFDDGIVYLKNSNVLFVGENYKPNYLTYLGMFGLKSFNTWGEKALAKLDNKTIVVPAHGQTLRNKQELLAYRSNYKAWFDRINSLYQEGQSANEMSTDQLALSFVNKLNLDNNPEHHSNFYQSSISGLIRFEMDKPMTLTASQMQDYVGSYQLTNKEDIQVEILAGRLVAKQKNSFISWLKPIAQDKFESMTFYGEQISFSRNKSGDITAVKASFPKKTHYQERLTGQWSKIENSSS
jgi:glyoxylase-like metal-dependent hydrolase (beta-lactamase superfamily II)